MKIFVFIFLNLVILNAQATDAPLVLGTKSEQQEAYERERQTKEDEQKPCEDAYKEYSEAKKESLKEAKDEKNDAIKDLNDLKSEHLDKTTEAQEKASQSEDDVKQAQITYKKAQDAIKEELDALEEETNTAAQAKLQEIQNKISELETLTGSAADEIDLDYQNSLTQGYEQCKAAAEQNFAARIGLDRESNAKINQGLKKSSGVTLANGSAIKKAKAESIALHRKCVSETYRVFESKRQMKLKDLHNQQNRKNQEINTAKAELSRLTGDGYTKKVSALQEKLRTAGAELVSAQEKLAKDQFIAQQAQAAEGSLFNEQLNQLQAKIAAADPGTVTGSKDLSESQKQDREALENAQRLCCDGKKPKYAVSGPTPSFCAVKSKKKHSSRASK